MTQEQQKEYTRVIAEFMGANDELYPSNIPSHGYEFCGSWEINIDSFKYNQSFDWLMPIWVKFRDLKTSPLKRSDNIFIYNQHLERIGHKILYTDNPKEAFIALAQAIIWYNENK